MSLYIKEFDATVDATFSRLADTGFANLDGSIALVGVGTVGATKGATVGSTEAAGKGGGGLTLNGNIVVGSIGNSAITVTFDMDGNVLSQNQYTLTDLTIDFKSVLSLENGDYLFFGSRRVSTSNSLALVVRTKNDGTVIWANTYGNATTRLPLHIIKSTSLVVSGTGSFIFICKNIVSTTDEDIEVVKIDGSGNVLASEIIGAKSTQEQAAGIFPFTNGGAIIYGGTNAVATFDSFMIVLDNNLNFLYTKLFSAPNFQEIRAVYPGAHSGDYIVSGDIGLTLGNKVTFLFSFNISTDTSVKGKTFDLVKGADIGYRKLVKIKTDYYLFGYKQGGSYAAKFDSNLNLVWTKKLNIPGTNFISDAITFSNTTDIILCGWIQQSNQLFPMLLETDSEFKTCLTLTNPNPTAVEIIFRISDWKTLTVTRYVPNVTEAKLNVEQNPVPNNYLCPQQSTNISVEGLIQSPYVYMQAAGSDHNDNSSAGVHLRWEFRKILGESHLAKGPYANPSSPFFTNIGFNKPNDYIKIYRAPYNNRYQVAVKFANNILPTQEINTGATREWHYNGLTTNGAPGTTNVIVRFNDVAQYNVIRATMTTLKPKDFLAAYTGIVEVEPDTKLFFDAEFDFNFTSTTHTNAYLRAEAISFDDSTDPSTIFVACRNRFLGDTQLNAARVTCENLKYIRLDFSIAYPKEIRFETYKDFILATNALNNNANKWQLQGDFSLTLDTATAYDRLENNNNIYVPANRKYLVDKQWDKYNESNAGTGEFKVRVANYKHRWNPVANAEHPNSNPADGIQSGIVEYLTASVFDVKAVISVPVENDPGNQAQLDISFLDILNFAGIDYHIARMLGLGTIDANVPNTTQKYVYLMYYTSQGQLLPSDLPDTLVNHIYLTLPTGKLDYRLPATPVLKPITYGLAVPNATPHPTQLTDAQGYVPFDSVRFVNTNRDLYNYEKPFGNFFVDPTLFSLCDETIPVCYGIEYKATAEPNYRKPEISSDEDYFDTAGFNEVLEIAETGTNPVYTHQEREEGIHCYGLYAVNWFSRHSPVSQNQCTDYTQFPLIKNLMPPSNFAVQLIQPETPLMLTTLKEQTMLAAIASADKTLMRATFEWNYNHNINYQFAERAEMFYRETPPASIQGEVLSVSQPNNNQVIVTVKDSLILSTNPWQIVAPTIPSGEENKYIGSLFTANQKGFVITAINNSGIYPVFTLNQIKETSSADPLNTNQIITSTTYVSPEVGDKFLVVENLAVDQNWSTKIARRVYLEKYHTNKSVRIENSANGNDGIYRIETVTQVGSNTQFGLFKENIKNVQISGDVVFEKIFRLFSFNTTTNTLIIAGNVTGDFTGVTQIRLFGSSYDNDKVYSIAAAPVYNAPNTEFTIIGTIIDLPANFGYVTIEKTAAIIALDKLNKTITVQGVLTSEIIPPHFEYRTEYNGEITKLPVGGIFEQATITDLPDAVTNQNFGAYTINFNSFTLIPHIDPSIDWYKGTVRVFDMDGKIRSLQIWQIERDSNTGNILSPLQLIAYDPTFNDPNTIYIQTGINRDVNYHPSYRFYLNAEFDSGGNNDATHQFNQVTMLPAIGDGSKLTFMGIRSIDRVKNPPNSNTIVQLESYIATPVPVLAQEIVSPAAPRDLSGPLFATRPDFYKKSSYTVDIKLDTSSNRKPFGILVFRGNAIKVLQTLYSDTTLTNIVLPALQTLRDNETNAYYSILHDLVNVVVDSSGNFVATANTQNFVMPLADNPSYIVPDRNPSNADHAFVPPLLMNNQLAIDKVRQAILDSFLSLTEQPVIYRYVKGGVTTSGRKPIIRNSNGDLLPPILPTQFTNADDYDPHPMAVKFSKDPSDPSGNIYLPWDSNYANGTNDFYVRFTDYTLDGASTEIYFYYASEITNQLIIGPPSPVKAPVLMVNSAPAEAPGIKRVLTQLLDSVNNIPTAVKFELNPFIEVEGIKKFNIYRANKIENSFAVRNMKLAKTVNVGDPVIDDFSDIPFPLYGDPLFYKIVALREIQNEQQVTELILSLPSNTALTNVVDVINPPPPQLQSVNGTTTTALLQNVILKWPTTCYNGTYFLQAQNASGNWVEIYRIKSNDAILQYPPLDQNGQPDFTNFPETISLDRKDADGNPIYHRFRVQVENSSGLLNLTENELTLAKGCTDLQEIPNIVSYTDSNHTINTLISEEVDNVISFPGFMTFTDISSPLPAGHNSFVKTDIQVKDDLGNSFTKTINAPAGNSVTFNNGEGGLVFDNSNPNRTYTITTRTFTDNCSSGGARIFTIKYIAGPCHDLSHLTSIVSLMDNTHTVSPLVNGNINDGVAQPVFLKFTDISNPSSQGQLFDHMDIKVTDDLGNTSTKTIPFPGGGDVTFINGDGGLVLDNSNPNRTFTIEAKLFTNLCTAGTTFDYSVSYTFTPCDQLVSLTTIANYSDFNGHNLSPLANAQFTTGANNPETITLTETVSSNLPSGHSFDHLDVIVEDDLGGADIKTIGSQNGSVVFSNGEGGLILDNSNPDRTYTITLVLFTDLCSNGNVFVYQVKYAI